MMPESGDPAREDMLAAALDDAVDPRPSRLATGGALARFAGRLQGDAAVLPSDAERGAIWERLVASHPEAAGAWSPPVPGGGATTTLPAGTLRPAARPLARPDRRTLRFVPEYGGFSPLTLILAAVLLATAIFSALRPDDQRGFAPSVSATEFAPATPPASPASSPVVGYDGVEVQPGDTAHGFAGGDPWRTLPWYLAEPVDATPFAVEEASATPT